MPLLTPCPVPGVINLCCSSQSGTGGWMPNGKKSASRQLSAKWSALDSYKHPAAPPAVNRAGTKPCCSLWKCSTKKATGKAALAPLQRCGTVPAALPMHPDCTGSSTLQEGCWGAARFLSMGRGCTVSFKFHSGAAKVPAGVCSARGQELKADIMQLFIHHLARVRQSDASVGRCGIYLMGICSEGECELTWKPWAQHKPGQSPCTHPSWAPPLLPCCW